MYIASEQDRDRRRDDCVLGSGVVVARVDSEIAIELVELSNLEIAAFERAFELPSPRYIEAQRRGASTMYIPRTVSALRRVDGELRIPRAAFGIVRRILNDRVRWVDNRCAGRPVSFAALKAPRDHQMSTADEFLRATTGICNATTGGGKTLAAAQVMHRCSASTLWLSPTIDLGKQAGEEVRGSTGVTPTFCTNGRYQPSCFVIATWATAAKFIGQLRGAFGLVVVDECHGALAATRLAVLRQLDAKYRLGLSATLKREDVRAPLLGWHFGKVVGRFTPAEGIGTGVLLRPTWRDLETDFRFDYRGPNDWPALQDALYDDEDRKRRIAAAVAVDAPGRLALLLSARKAPLLDMRDLLLGRGVRAEVLHGDLRRDDREAILVRARGGKTEALLATSLADEGLSISCADRLFLTSPQTSPTRLLQRVGRVVRVQKDKRTPQIIDVVDQHVGVLAYQARQRKRIFDQTWGAAMRGES